MVIETEQGLQELCGRLRDCDRLALDTEFVSERTYVPQIGLIQVAGNGAAAAVDPLAVQNLDPLIALFQDPAIEKVVHAGRQELEILEAHGHGQPQPIFDVQIAAGFLGYGDQPSYARLVQDLLGLRLRKKETFTNWLQRPLRPGQIEYALADVEYLIPVADQLREKLAAKGRIPWAEEEFAKLTEIARWPRVEPGQEYQTVAGWGQLDPRTLGVLSELANWREREAQRRNWPRRVVLGDTVLVELARHKPTQPGELRGIRALPRRVADKSAADVVAAVKRGMSLPEAQLPAPPRRPKPDPHQPAVVDLLAAVVKMRAMAMQVAASLLATRSDLETLVLQFRNGEEADSDLPLLQGWRREVVGEDLLALLAGTTALRLDPTTGRVRTEGREGEGRG